MQELLLEHVRRSAPAWVRYMVSLAEMVRTGEVWLIADGDDVAVWETDAGPAVAIWPAEHLAEEDVDTPGTAVAIPVAEFAENILPRLAEQGFLVAAFPNFEDDMLVDAEAAANDLADFTANDIDIAPMLEGEVDDGAFDEWVVLERPTMLGPRGGARTVGLEAVVDASLPAPARYAPALDALLEEGLVWLLSNDDGIAGVLVNDEPAIAVFPTREYAKAFAAREHVPAQLESIELDEFDERWLPIAFAGGWRIALAPVNRSAAVVDPLRMALDLGARRAPA